MSELIGFQVAFLWLAVILLPIGVRRLTAIFSPAAAVEQPPFKMLSLIALSVFGLCAAVLFWDGITASALLALSILAAGLFFFVMEQKNFFGLFGPDGLRDRRVSNVLSWSGIVVLGLAFLFGALFL